MAAERTRKAPGELRFDMFDGEFTHVGDKGTFEVLMERFGLDHDAALLAIGEIAHDIDYQDDKYRRAETEGVPATRLGISEGTRNDLRRITQGSTRFDALYQSVGRSSAVIDSGAPPILGIH